MPADVHPVHEQGDGEDELGRGHEPDERELPAEAADARAACREQLGRHTGEQPQRQEDRADGERGVAPVPDERGEGDDRRGQQRGEHPAGHGAKRYPTPQTVWR